MIEPPRTIGVAPQQTPSGEHGALGGAVDHGSLLPRSANRKGRSGIGRPSSPTAWSDRGGCRRSGWPGPASPRPDIERRRPVMPSSRHPGAVPSRPPGRVSWRPRWSLEPPGPRRMRRGSAGLSVAMLPAGCVGHGCVAPHPRRAGRRRPRGPPRRARGTLPPACLAIACPAGRHAGPHVRAWRVNVWG